jgi:IclR family KDG regulon transcriptional repressor
MDKDQRPAVLNSSVSKAFAILELLANADSPKELVSICNALQMNKSTTYRFLATLKSLGYVVQDIESNRYALGSKLVWLASRFLDAIDLRTIARPVLRQLREETGETVHLAILDHFEVVYIDKLDGRSAVRMASSVGNRVPVHSTGLGKVLFAFMPEDVWRSYVKKVGLERRTSNTITDPAAFFEQLRLARECNYSIDNCENEDGIRCVAVPIRDHTGKVVAAFSITGWMITMKPDRDQELATMGLNFASIISAKLGYLQKELVSV